MVVTQNQFRKLPRATPRSCYVLCERLNLRGNLRLLPDSAECWNVLLFFFFSPFFIFWFNRELQYHSWKRKAIMGKLNRQLFLQLILLSCHLPGKKKKKPSKPCALQLHVICYRNHFLKTLEPLNFLLIARLSAASPPGGSTSMGCFTPHPHLLFLLRFWIPFL